MDLQLYKWYETSEHNLQYSLIPWKQDILEADYGVLLDFGNNLISFDRYFYYNDKNYEYGRNQKVHRFMIIEL